MSKAAFPVNDLLRRKLQTSLTIITLALSVGSTLFLLLFSDRIGFGITSSAGTLTQGLSAIFSQFVLFVGVLIFAVGAVLTSFIVYSMMTQRTRDFGLIKAAGCPNGLVAGYFMTELLTITFISCTLGTLLGFLIDFAATNLGNFQAYEKPPNYWFVPLVFAAFFALALIFGTKPILNASRMSPVRALSPVNYYGLGSGKKHKPLSRSGVTWKIASRSLFRRQSASIRIVILLSAVFILLTVSIAGGLIASGTTESWLEKTVDKNTVVVAHSSMAAQYRQLLSKFSGAASGSVDFNYSDTELAIPSAVVQQLSAISSIATVDARLVLEEHVYEVSNFTIDPETLVTYPVGDSREGDSLIVGIDPSTFTSPWALQGRFLTTNDTLEAVLGDSIARDMFSPDPAKDILFSNPLVQSVRLQNSSFRIVGVRVDPLNNGRVIYVPVEKLQNVAGTSGPNIVFVKLDSPTDRDAATAEIRSKINVVDSDLGVFELEDVGEENRRFLTTTWSSIMLLPLFTLISAALCLVGYIMLAVDEQHQEFAILRAIGAKPRIVVAILAFQSITVLLSSFGVGTSFGVIITLLILMSKPLVTSITVIEIAAWLFTALGGMFILSLYPAIRLAKTSILKIMT
jgi:ABC-type antimicrobial peptide transport system permease subunit